MIDERLENVLDPQQIESISNESIVYKGKKEHLGRSFAADLGFGIFSTCSLHPVLCKDT
jgi:hypothetical protein